MAVAYTVPTIAITGSPKDYTGIVAARQRQQAADDAKVQSEGRKKDAELRKALFIKPGEMLPGRTAEALDLISETIKQMDVAKQEGDFNAMSDAQAKTFARLGAFKEEKNAFDAAKKDYDAGKVVVGREFLKAYEAKDAEALKALGNSAIFNEQTGTYTPVKNMRIDLTARQRELANNFKPEPTGKLAYNFAGQPYEELSVPVERVRQASLIDFDTDPLVRTNAVHNYIASNPQSQGLSNDEIIEKARIQYGENGVSLALSDQTRKGGKGGIEIKNYVNVGDGSDQATPFGGYDKVTKVVATNPTNGEKEVYESTSHYGHSFGNVKITAAVPGAATFVESGEPVNDAQLRDATFNQFVGKVVFNRNWKNPLNGKVYPKGAMVPIEYEDAVIRGGYGKAATLGMGLSSNGESLSYSAEGLTPSAFSAATDKEKVLVEKQWKQAKQDEAILQADIEKRYLKARKEKNDFSGSYKKPAPKPQPKPEPKSDKPKVNQRLSSKAQSTLKELE